MTSQQRQFVKGLVEGLGLSDSIVEVVVAGLVAWRLVEGMVDVIVEV